MLRSANVSLMIAIAITVFFMSCGGEKTVNKKESETSSDSVTNLKTGQSNDSSKESGSNITAISGLLHTLWTDSTTFNRTGRRIVFRFYAKSPDSLTLDGWTTKQDTFPVPPVRADILLNIGQVSTIPFGNKTYFGNLILSGRDRRKVTDSIRLGKNGPFKFILFIPLNPQDAAQAGQITYKIEVTNDDPSKFVETAAVSSTTRVNLNPSPPRNP